LAGPHQALPRQIERAQARDLAAVEDQAARVDGQRAGEAAETRGLARVGGAAQGQDLAFLEGEGQRVEQGDGVGEAGEPDDLQDLHAGRILTCSSDWKVWQWA